MNTYDGPYPPGVPNPYTPMLHSYPTRYHGPIYTRPMFRKPWFDRPYDFGVSPGMAGVGEMAPQTHVACDDAFPVPEDVQSPDDFAAYMQNEACHERVKASADSRRWLLGLGAAFVVGAMFGRTL